MVPSALCYQVVAGWAWSYSVLAIPACRKIKFIFDCLIHYIDIIVYLFLSSVKCLTTTKIVNCSMITLTSLFLSVNIALLRSKLYWNQHDSVCPSCQELTSSSESLDAFVSWCGFSTRSCTHLASCPNIFLFISFGNCRSTEVIKSDQQRVRGSVRPEPPRARRHGLGPETAAGGWGDRVRSGTGLRRESVWHRSGAGSRGLQHEVGGKIHRPIFLLLAFNALISMFWQLFLYSFQSLVKTLTCLL